MAGDRSAVAAAAQRRTAFARIEQIGVGSRPAGHNVAARASGDQVVAGPRVDRIIAFLAQDDVVSGPGVDRVLRSEVRRVGKAFVRTCKSWWSPLHSKKTKQSYHNYTKQN